MEKTAYNMLYEAYMEKEAWVNAASKAIGSFMKTTGKQALISGAKRGAALGAFNGLVSDPGTDANGNKRSRIGSVARGALMGGAVGGVANGVGAAAKTQSFQTAVGNARNQINDWAKVKFPNTFGNKTASEELSELCLEKLAGGAVSMGATAGAFTGAMRGIGKGYAKNGIKGAVKSGINKGTIGMLMGAGAGALLDRISAPPQQNQQNPGTTQNFNG
jgi:hypothetical protein